MGVPVLSIQGWGPYGPYGHMMGWGWGWGMMVAWGIILLILVAIVLWAVLRPRREERGQWDRDPAEEILREQYARGEIDEETFRRRLEELRRS